jgi:hypothetical protein
MEKAIWAFVRSGERLTIEQERTRDGIRLILTGPGVAPRAMLFESAIELCPFQSDMEQLLVATGWTLEAFSPERRTGHDRRRAPRITNDRRRWWTDPVGPDVRPQAAFHDAPQN